MTDTGHFDFPPLGPTGEGDPPYPARTGEVYWQPATFTGYFVTHQHDRPAVAFRCHYPRGSSPCDEQTALEFIQWAERRAALDVGRPS